MQFDAKYLAAIEVIRRERGLTRAAEKLGTSQPALSRLVSDLEIRLDANIFDRSQRPWVLTKIGRALAAQGALVLRAQDAAKRELQEFRSGTRARIRLVGPQFFTDGVISRLLTKFLDDYPEATFEVAYGYGRSLVEAVRSGRSDLAFVPRGAGDTEDGLVFRALVAARNVIACRTGHPILELAYPRPLALMDYGWISPPDGSPLAADLEMTLAELEIQDARVVFAGGALASVLNFLEGSDCLTVLPETTVDAIGQLFGIQAVPIKISAPSRTLGVLSRPVQELDHTSRVFVEFLIDQFSLNSES